MPTQLFNALDQEKRLKITQEALEEFAENSYSESSTNNIVKRAGISKGSLFKYFTNKEDLYFYILDDSIQCFLDSSKEAITTLPNDFFERVVTYADIEFTWYMHHPMAYRLLKKAFIDDQSDIYKKTIKKYQVMGNSFFYTLFQDINMNGCKWDKNKILELLKWLLEGFNASFMKDIAGNEGIDSIKDRYLKELQEYMTILKEGICKE